MGRQSEKKVNTIIVQQQCNFLLIHLIIEETLMEIKIIIIIAITNVSNVKAIGPKYIVTNDRFYCLTDAPY